ncbi:MAG: glucose-1-phosphate adenylyltransferase subunit GlgD [Clostridia bacterium]|nr:glucose-1-phosphate adenylyltransferase subunit GlgD [Clostridia bacterium]
MKDAMGIIYTEKDDLSLRELTSQRSVAALPVAGRYRIVDFLLSNMVNSGVRNVGVITQKNYQSLMDHLGAGKEWDLHTRNNGLFILPPFINGDKGGEYSGVLEALRANFDYLRRSKQELVVVANGNAVYSADFEPMLRQHEESGADVTIMYSKVSAADQFLSTYQGYNHAYVNIGDDNKVTDIEVNPNAASYENMSMDVLVIKRTLLMHLVDQAYSSGLRDIYGELLRAQIKTGMLDVRGYEYEGYYRRVETVRSFYKLNMDILGSYYRKALFGDRPVYTKERDEVPAIYGPDARVKNSLIADGCVINGIVENCVIFRGVHIGAGTVVKNSIIMQDGYIEDNVELDHVIFDKAVTMRAHGRLIGQPQYPIVIGKNVTL